MRRQSQKTLSVAPYTGAWIEIRKPAASKLRNKGSLPTRERGLKFCVPIHHHTRHPVAPYTGAWIEIKKMLLNTLNVVVAPYTGAWIEIRLPTNRGESTWSLPTRERGLK